MNGILIVDKPEEITSAEVVRRVKRSCGGKIGHLGTLDPFATGVLPLCLGDATKIAQFLNAADKDYEGIVQLGHATDTGDRTGQVTRTSPVPPIDAAELSHAARRFVGEYRQVPPMYSALKRDGVPLYRLAREGVEVERESRTVRIHSLRVVQVADNQLRFEVSCSKGTYVRVLAEDLGSALGTAAHLASLRRTRFGTFDLSQAVELGTWDPGTRAGLLSIRQALAHLPTVEIDAAAAAAVKRGQGWVLQQIMASRDTGAVLLLAPDGDALAVVVNEDGRWRFGRVLAHGS